MTAASITGSSHNKIKEHRFSAYFLGEEKLPESDVFSLEKAHSLMLNARLPTKSVKRYLRKRKCHIETHQLRGLHLTKRGLFSNVVPLWLDYSTVRRFYVFKMEPCMLVLGVSSPDLQNRFYILRFKQPDQVNQFCDHIEQRKSTMTSGGGGGAPAGAIATAAVPLSASSAAAGGESNSAVGTPTAKTRTMFFSSELTEKGVAAATAAAVGDSYDGGDSRMEEDEEEDLYPEEVRAQQAANTKMSLEELYQEIQSPDETADDEMSALRRYDEVLNGYDGADEIPTPPSPRPHDALEEIRKRENQKAASEVEPEYTKSLPYRKPRESHTRESIVPGAHSFCSLGRPRQRSEIPALLFRKSQRHRILSEDVRFLNYGPNGYYETSDGPIFFYVAHMKSTIEESGESSENRSETGADSPPPPASTTSPNRKQNRHKSFFDNHSDDDDPPNNSGDHHPDHHREEDDTRYGAEAGYWGHISGGAEDEDEYASPTTGDQQSSKQKGSYSKNPTAAGKYVNKNYAKR